MTYKSICILTEAIYHLMILKTGEESRGRVGYSQLKEHIYRRLTYHDIVLKFAEFTPSLKSRNWTS